MNRTGLYIALGLLLIVTTVFGLYPDLDLKLAGLFWDPATKTFPIKSNAVAEFARDAAMVIAWAFVLPAILALTVKLTWPNRRMMMSGRVATFLILSMLVAAGLLTNLTFKSVWSRPRPIQVTEFSGPYQFKAWWDPTGECRKNCSFISGEGATAFWTYAPAALAPPAWRPLAYVAATVFGATTSLLRMTFGGHFFTDVTLAGLLTFIVIWLMHAYLFRWRAAVFTDERIDAALTRFAWPGYRWRQKLWGRDVGPSPAS